MKTSIEIAQTAKMKPIAEIAAMLGIKDYIEPYGKYMAKIMLEVFEKVASSKDAKLILVTAITPTPAGEGKTVTAIGLSQALWNMRKRNIVCLRQPSLGPTFGLKGGGAGGGRCQIQPMQEINLHFTGDFHAITSANNLLAALLDNHIFHGNKLNIDLQQIVWKRALDMNDRALRKVIVGVDMMTRREESFQITSASEVMAALCLAGDFADLKKRLSRLIIAYTKDGKPVTASAIKAHGAMMLLLKDAIKPNLVQTLENTPAIVHGGPFGNIAHGAPTAISIKMASKLADYVIVEAGFGSDLGAEKFLHIICPEIGIIPSAAVIVVTIRALKMHGGIAKGDLAEDVPATERGIPNLEKHVENMQLFGIPVVVALNRMEDDSKDEIKVVEEFCRRKGIPFAESNVFERGGEGGVELAKAVSSAMKKVSFSPLYSKGESIKAKVQKIAKLVYGAGDIVYTEIAERAIRRIESMGYGNLPICFAKTQFSLSDDPKKIGRPEGFELRVTDATISAGAGFVIVYAGDITTMPGLSRSPAAEKMDIDAEGRIYGLF